MAGTNFAPIMAGYTGQKPFKFWCQTTLPMVYDESLSYYELLCKVVNYINNLISDTGALESNVTGLNNAYLQLQDFVNNYFDSTDFQQLVDNNLDEMAENGTLLVLVSGALQNIQMGENNLSDSLKLKVIKDYVTPEMFGAKGDGMTDDYHAIQDCIDYAFEHNARVEFSRKTYVVSDTVKLYGNCVYNGNFCTILQTSDVPTMATYKYFDESKNSYYVIINDFWLEGNANNANNDGLILCGWREWVNHVNIDNVGGHGIVITSYLNNGNEIASSTRTLVEGMVRNSRFRTTNPDKYPLYVHCSAGFTITDWRVENSIFRSPDCPCFMWFDRIAGWFLTDVQCYGNARNCGIFANFASGTHMENITLDGIAETGIYFSAQVGSSHATNVHINVSDGVTGEIYAIRQTGGSSNPAALAIANIDVNVNSDTTPSALYLHRGSNYIFDVVNPVFIKNHAEISYQYFYFLGTDSVFRLNGLKILSNTPINESVENFSRSYSTSAYGNVSTTLTLTITPSRTIDKAGLLLVAGEVNGIPRGNSVYSVGLFHRSTAMPCQLISEQSGYEFTDVSVSYDSSTNTYTVAATTPNTNNCKYSMNVIF